MGKEENIFYEDTVDAAAVVGLAGRFPGARNVHQFWRNLQEGKESIRHFTDQELEDQGIPPEWLRDPNYVKAGTILDDYDKFDAGFFGYSPKEAENIDPQQRIFLETAWEALESAGYNPETYGGSIGVFAGSNPNEYRGLFPGIMDPRDAANSLDRLIGNENDFLCTRVSYKFNLRGPSITVQTGCSTSLVAVQLACQSLLNYQCNLALAGGVSISLRNSRGYFYQEGMIPSSDGHCRAFDAGASGTVLSQGVGVVVLKRLTEALSDRDSIYAVIKGIAINNDGGLKAGYTAPSVNGQAEVIVMAQALSGVSADSIGYVEAHGTGTVLGDPIEIAALTQAFRSSTERKRFCAVGSVKTNIGHADAAAGIAGLIKTILMLKNRQIPASLHFERPNPNIDFENSAFFVPTKLSEWAKSEFPRRAGVSSFGIGGTNVHAVLEEAPETDYISDSRPKQLLLLSAKTNTALEAVTRNLCEYLGQNESVPIADVAYTLQTGRKAFTYRRFIVCHDSDDAIQAMNSANPQRVRTHCAESQNPEIVFMFPGQGSQYVNMGLELYRTDLYFRKHIDHCSEILRSYLTVDIQEILYPEKGRVEEIAQQLKQTAITQPALFILEYALAKLWISWGMTPAAMVGHSIGEYVAANLSGVISLEDALFLVSTRGRLMQQARNGSMLAVQLSEKDIQQLLNPRLSLAAVNAPSLCVVSGEDEDVKQLESDLEKHKVAFTHLHTSHAFHSDMMEPILPPFLEQLEKIRFHPPQIPFVSNLTGTWITPEEAMSPGYWSRHLRYTVRFSNCVQELIKHSDRIFLEVGPGRTLGTFVRQHSNGPKGRVVLSSMRHPKEERSDSEFILSTLGQLWLEGVQVDWSGFYKDEHRFRIPLPTYPFERKRYWLEPAEQPRGFFLCEAGLAKLRDDFQRSRKCESANNYSASENPEGKDGYVAPRNDVEKNIAEIWQKLLGVKQISIHDNFFNLGGSSLTAVRLFAQIEKMFGKRLPPSSLFEAQTLEQLSALLSESPLSRDRAVREDVPYTVTPGSILENKQDIVGLLERNFNQVLDKRYAWIYEGNPVGPATCLLAKDTKEDLFIGVQALFPRKVFINGKCYHAALGGDFAVNKEHRVIAPALLLQNAVISHCNEGNFDFLYGFPNRESQAVNKMLGLEMFDVLRMTKPLKSYYYLKRRVNVPKVAGIMSGPIDFMMKLQSREFRYRGFNGLTSNIPSYVDERFDVLWNKVSAQISIIGERSSSYLNWRYIRSPYHKHHIFSLEEKGNGNIHGYIVFHVEENVTNIDDLLSVDMNETLDSLLSEFILFQRKEGIDSISICYAGTPSIVRKLQDFGFSIRDKEDKIIFYIPPNSPVLPFQLIKENVHFLGGDNDV